MTALELYLAMPNDAKAAVEAAVKEGMKFADAVATFVDMMKWLDKPGFEALKNKVTFLTLGANK